jgi:hypothetical protein
MRIGRLYGEQAHEWLFPPGSQSRHVVEHQEKRRDLSKWGNDMRQTFRTIAQAAGELGVHLLMNHSIPGVNAGYITRNKLLSGHLRQQRKRSHVGCSKPIGREGKNRSVTLPIGLSFPAGAYSPI